MCRSGRGECIVMDTYLSLVWPAVRLGLWDLLGCLLRQVAELTDALHGIEGILCHARQPDLWKAQECYQPSSIWQALLIKSLQNYGSQTPFSVERSEGWISRQKV